ncbi:hypothetical protein [Streptomyces arboris]|uniref:hypothetical protein n=2 Tax=Streptomyces TaxID=1883 RepID=UPI003BF52392
MSLTYDDIAEQQADLVRQLLPYLRAPLPDGQVILCLLPPPPPSEAVRIAVGPGPGEDHESMTVWEIPLRADARTEDLLGGDDVLALVRALHTGTQIFSSSRMSTVMGMPLVRVDPTRVRPASPDGAEGMLTILRTLVCPWTEEQPEPRLRGFLQRDPDRLRLYLDRGEDPDVVAAADVRTSGALTALLAALPSLIEETGGPPEGDPHCSRLVDLTSW